MYEGLGPFSYHWSSPTDTLAGPLHTLLGLLTNTCSHSFLGWGTQVFLGTCSQWRFCNFPHLVVGTAWHTLLGTLAHFCFETMLQDFTGTSEQRGSSAHTSRGMSLEV